MYKKTKKNSVVSSHFNTSNEAFSDTVLALSSASILILLAKAKYLRVFTCAIIRVQVMGVEKVTSVFFSKTLSYKKEEQDNKSGMISDPLFRALSSGLFSTIPLDKFSALTSAP